MPSLRTVIVFSNCLISVQHFAEQKLEPSVAISSITVEEEPLETTESPIIVTPGPFVITPVPSEVIRPTVVIESEDQSEQEEEEETTTRLSEVAEDSEELEGEAGIKNPDSKFEQLKRDGKKKGEDDDEEKSIEDERHSAELSFKERLKARFNKFRQEHKGFLNKKNKVETTPITRNRNTSNRFNSNNSDEESDSGEKRERPKFGKNGRTDLIRKKLEEVLRRTSVVEESTLRRTFVPSFLRTEIKTSSSRIRPTNVRNLFNVDSSTRSPFSFHRNKGFTRPTIRKNLLNRVLGKTTQDKETEKTETESSEAEATLLIDSSIDPASAKTTPEPITKSEQPEVSIVTPSPNPPIISGPVDLKEEKKDLDSHEPTLKSSFESLDEFTVHM